MSSWSWTTGPQVPTWFLHAFSLVLWLKKHMIACCVQRGSTTQRLCFFLRISIRGLLFSIWRSSSWFHEKDQLLTLSLQSYDSQFWLAQIFFRYLSEWKSTRLPGEKINGFHWDLELIFASKDALNLHPCETNQLESEKKMMYLKTTFVLKWLMFFTCHMSASFLGV